jgi:hypothetical protein
LEKKNNKIELRNEKKLLFIFWYAHSFPMFFKTQEKGKMSAFHFHSDQNSFFVWLWLHADSCVDRIGLVHKCCAPFKRLLLL